MALLCTFMLFVTKMKLNWINFGFCGLFDGNYCLKIHGIGRFLPSLFALNLGDFSLWLGGHEK